MKPRGLAASTPDLLRTPYSPGDWCLPLQRPLHTLTVCVFERTFFRERRRIMSTVELWPMQKNSFGIGMYVSIEKNHRSAQSRRCQPRAALRGRGGRRGTGWAVTIPCRGHRGFLRSDVADNSKRGGRESAASCGGRKQQNSLLSSTSATKVGFSQVTVTGRLPGGQVPMLSHSQLS